MRLGSRAGARVVAVLVAIACGCAKPAPPPSLVIDWDGPISVRAGTVARASFRVRDAAGHPVQGARLRVEAQMTHPGMAPVLADAVERAPGLYEVPLAFDMAGDWVLAVSGSRATGEPVSQPLATVLTQPSN